MPDNNTRLLSNIAQVFYLHQLIEEPTRITDKSSTLIDVIYTNNPDKVVCSGVCHISISDHSLVYAFRKASIDPPTKGHSTLTYKNLNILIPAVFAKSLGIPFPLMTIQTLCGMHGRQCF